MSDIPMVRQSQRGAYAFPFGVCEVCWHCESILTIRNKIMLACPVCGGKMREAGVPTTEAPSPGAVLLCIVCARYKPWGIWDSTSGVTVCIECRDKAMNPADRASPPPPDRTPL